MIRSGKQIQVETKEGIIVIDEIVDLWQSNVVAYRILQMMRFSGYRDGAFHIDWSCLSFYEQHNSRISSVTLRKLFAAVNLINEDIEKKRGK